MRVSVLPATNLDKTYTYGLPDGAEMPPAGTFVLVPLAGRKVLGCVWDDGPDMAVSATKLRNVEAVYSDFAPLDAVVLRFIERVADYTVSPKGEVLKMFLSAPKALTGKRVIKKMPVPCENPLVSHEGVELSDVQRQAADVLVEAVEAGVVDGGQAGNEGGEFSCTLLDGVTGSGKTEVYFEAVAKALELGRQVLILVPEISLSNAFLGRFAARFGVQPGLWHSGLSEAERKNTWKAVATGGCKVVVGARSALFLPYRNLGLVVIDEEHDQGYKQEDGVRYHARDMAVLRAHMAGFPVVLVSATPSLETQHNVRSGRYRAVHMPDRFGGATLPDVKILSLKDNSPEKGCFIAPVLKEALANRLAQGEQTLLFLNRRGYAPLTLCRSCGHRVECPNCSAWMVEHRAQRRLSCHHCGHSMREPDACPKCEAPDSLVAIGPGVERIAEEVKEFFPQARVLVLASDIAGGDALYQALEAIRTRSVDVIIGTQIIAKGHHFPHLTLVGVVDADLGLSGGDLRASERTWQLLHQVAGRAGRGEAGGEVFLQTWLPESRVMQSLAAHARDAFVDVELMERREADMPPFSRLCAIVLAGTNPNKVEEVARMLAVACPQAHGVQVLGPAPSPVFKLRSHYRYRFLLVAERNFPVQAFVKDWLKSVKIPSSIRVGVDVDPYNFM